MSLISLFFIAFCILTVLVYYVVPKKAQWVVLLVASVFFYCTYGWAKIFFLLIPSVIAYICALLIDKVYKSERTPEKKKKIGKAVCLIGAISFIVLLLYVKAGNYLNLLLQKIFKGESVTLSIIVALGVSYYVFSLISYVTDVYRKKDTAEKNYFKFLLYVIYFPKILQGPIVKHKSIANELTAGHSFDGKLFVYGIEMMLWGFFKKMVIADRLVVFLNTTWGDLDTKPGVVVVFAGICSMFQLYCDFSGCMDILGGVSRCFGIELTKNFNHPFLSQSGAEFWRRWHITLGEWFKDYVFMPISLGKKFVKMTKAVRNKLGVPFSRVFSVAVPLLTVWLLTGLWHNIRLEYLAWGVFWGVIIIIENIHATKNGTKKEPTTVRKWLNRLKVWVFFFLSRMLTAPGSMSTSIKAFSRFASFSFAGLSVSKVFGMDWKNLVIVFVSLVLLFLVEAWEEKKGVRSTLENTKPGLRIALDVMLALFIIIFGYYGMGYNAASFVYMAY